MATFTSAVDTSTEHRNRSDPRASGDRPPAAASLAGPSGLSAGAKRALDVVVASLALLLAAPLLLVATLAIRIDSPGPAIFRQRRLGANGRAFTMLKLRSMCVDNDDRAHRAYVADLLRGEAHTNSGLYKLTDDPRITTVGRILRRLSLDEVPQLVNVVLGHMSLVGPRPPLPTEAELYDERDWGRLAGRPGITGLWQVSGRCVLTYRDMIELDLVYFQHWSFWSDVRILFKTPRAVLSRRGAA